MEDEEGRVLIPGSLKGLLRVADRRNSYAFIMPMRKRDGEWVAILACWELQAAKTNKVITSPAEISEQQIEMTDWKLQDVAV